MKPISTFSPAAVHRRRGGRPAADQAGEVDRRILDAATVLFLERGFDATSCDQVAAQAGAGKASLYARYANKEALFTAVVHRMIDRTLLPAVDVPWHAPVEERLRVVGHALLNHVLVPDAVALMRVVITTAHHLPELAHRLDRAGRDCGIHCVAQAIVGHGASREQVDQASALADRFIEMVFVPLQMRALFGDAYETLQVTAARRIDEAIALLAGAGHLDPWSTA